MILLEFVIGFALIMSVLACILQAFQISQEVLARLNGRIVEIEDYSSMLNEINSGVLSADAERGRWRVKIEPCAVKNITVSQVRILERGYADSPQIEWKLWKIMGRR
jgi:hypothetical protein